MINASPWTKAWAQAQRRKANALKRLVIEAERDTCADLVAMAVKLSSGPYKMKQLRQMARARPSNRGVYSKADPAPPAPGAFMINVQEGNVVMGWRAGLVQIGGQIKTDLWNVAPDFGFLAGGPKSKMIARPVIEEVAKRERANRLRRLRLAKKRALGA